MWIFSSKGVPLRGSPSLFTQVSLVSISGPHCTLTGSKNGFFAAPGCAVVGGVWEGEVAGRQQCSGATPRVGRGDQLLRQFCGFGGLCPLFSGRAVGSLVGTGVGPGCLLAPSLHAHPQWKRECETCVIPVGGEGGLPD